MQLTEYEVYFCCNKNVICIKINKKHREKFYLLKNVFLAHLMRKKFEKT